MSRAAPACRRPGFTLVELLVVMLLVSSLIGLLLPAVAAARDSSRSAGCLAHQRQLGIALAAYTADHRGQLVNAIVPLGHHPTLPPPLKKSSYAFLLEDYMDPLRDTRCPSDQSPLWETESAHSGRTRLVSYGLNIWTSRYFTGQFHDYTQGRPLPRPAATIAAGELVELDHSIYTFATVDWFSELIWSPTFGVPRGDYDRQIAADRHQHRPNWLYHDGHVAGHVRSDVQAGVGSGFNVVWTVNRFRPEVAQ